MKPREPFPDVGNSLLSLGRNQVFLAIFHAYCLLSRLGGRFLIVEIDRLSLGVGNQIVRRQLNFARAPNSPLFEPVFVIGQQPGHWISFARHRMNNSWFRMNDSAMPVPADPFQTQGGNYLINYVVFSVN